MYDFAGKWPLALKALNMGASPDDCFIDCAQSSGASGADDGAMLLPDPNGGCPRLAHVEVKSSVLAKGKATAFVFHEIRLEYTEWKVLLLVGRESTPPTGGRT